jgi:acetylornithine deacetylase/succinyl-diaminopimelate desuccinylase-like protein
LSITAGRVHEIARVLRKSAAPGALEEDLARSFAAFLDAAGMAVQIDDVVPGRPNVVGRLPGRGEAPALMLVSHFNSSFCGGAWKTDPYDVTLRDGWLYGGAISDAIGGLAAILAAVEPLDRNGPPPGDVVVLGTMSHDIKAVGVKYALASRNDWPTRAIWVDPTELAVVTSNAGGVRWQIQLEGTPAHISHREEGVDALRAGLELARRITDDTFTHVPHPQLADLPRVTIGAFHAGESAGLVADSCVIRGDVRTVPSMSAESVLADLQSLASNACPPPLQTRVEITGSQRPFLSSPDSGWAETVATAHQAVLGRPALVGTSTAARFFCTAAADLLANGVDAVVYGPGHFRWTANESISLDEAYHAARVYHALLTIAESGIG